MDEKLLPPLHHFFGKNLYNGGSFLKPLLGVYRSKHYQHIKSTSTHIKPNPHSIVLSSTLARSPSRIHLIPLYTKPTSPSRRPHIPLSAMSTPRPFLSLPGETRNRIYSYVLTVNVPDSTPWVTVRKDEAPLLRPDHSCLAILATCQQIHSEAFHVYYRNNTLNVASTNDLCSFTRAIGPARRNEIRSVRCDFPLAEQQEADARATLFQLRRLQSLSFEYVAYDPDWRCLRCPDGVFARFKGLREVGFIVKHEEPQQVHKDQMLHFREMLTRPRAPWKLPAYIDLFMGLKVRKQRGAAEEKAERKAKRMLEAIANYCRTIPEAQARMIEIHGKACL